MDGGWIESLAKNDVKYFIGLGMMDDATHHITAQHFQEIAAAAGLDVTWKEYNGGHLYSADQEEEALEFVKRVHGKMTGSR